MQPDETIELESNSLLQSELEITLDWEAYFRTFCERHGKYPVVYGKEDQLLLFPDGWCYSSTAYDGNEVPPPKDKRELYELQVYYWKRRYRIVKRELDDTKNVLDNINTVALSRSLPLQQVCNYTDEEGKPVETSKPLDLTAMRKRIQWLEGDVKNCKLMLEIVHQKIGKLNQELENGKINAG